MVLYKSTRGGVNGISFEEAVFMGLAKDKGNFCYINTKYIIINGLNEYLNNIM